MKRDPYEHPDEASLPEYDDVSMLEFAKVSRQQLRDVPASLWAVLFVELRMQFHRRYGRRLILSTVHGVDFFDNVINCAGGREWEEKGEYGNNFRKLFS